VSNAFGASITNATIVNDTEAFIDGKAHVFAGVKPGTPFFTDITGASRQGVSIEAESPKEVYIFAIGGSLSTGNSAARSFSVTVTAAPTHAYVKPPGASPPADAGITSDGSVNVVATSDLLLIGAAGSVAIGGNAGVGIGVDVGVATIRTRADVGDGAH